MNSFHLVIRLKIKSLKEFCMYLQLPKIKGFLKADWGKRWSSIETYWKMKTNPPYHFVLEIQSEMFGWILDNIFGKPKQTFWIWKAFFRYQSRATVRTLWERNVPSTRGFFLSYPKYVGAQLNDPDEGSRKTKNRKMMVLLTP